MKYIFYNHHNLSILLTENICKKLNIAKEDILIFFDRNIGLNNYPSFFDGISIIKIPEEFENKNFHLNWKLFSNRKKMNFFDKKLNILLCNNQFICFLPHSSFKWSRLMISHPKFKELNYFEEGIASYGSHHNGEENLKYIKSMNTIVNKIKCFFSYSNRLNFTTKYTTEGNKYYCLHEKCFPFVKKEKINVLKIKKEKSYKKTDNKISLVCFSPILESSLISKSSYTEGINFFLKYLKLTDRTNQVLLKFHPAQQPISKNLIYNELNKKQYKKRFNVLKENVSIERILVNEDDVNCYSENSSLGFYAYVFGHKYYSFLNIYKDNEKLINRVLSYPEIYHKAVKLIKI